MIIYVDFDGVLYDTVSIILDEIKRNNIDLEGNCNEFFRNLDWNSILKDAHEINNAVRVVNKLTSTDDVKILTHISSIEEMKNKANFINEKFGNIDIIFVPKDINKSKIVSPKGNVLIDDSKKNINDWNESGGIGILFDAKSDKDIEKIVKEVIL